MRIDQAIVARHNIIWMSSRYGFFKRACFGVHELEDWEEEFNDEAL